MPRAREPGERGIVWASFVTLLLATPAAGLDPDTALTQYGHTAWRVREGYFAGQPVAITQTKDGFLWIGTETGLIRFDGVRFMPWKPPAGSSLPDDRIINLLAARDGSLWIGTANGLAQWRAPNLVVHARVGRFGALLEDRRGTIWAGHTRAISELPPFCRFERGSFRCFGFADEHELTYGRALHEDRQGNIWLGGDHGVCRWQPETPENPECYAIGSLDRPGSAVFAIADDSDGSLWAITLSRGAWRLVAGRWTLHPDPELSGAILPDREGGLWLGSSKHGLFRIARGRTERFTRADGLSGGLVHDIFEDREGSLWIATSAGLDRFRDVKVATLTGLEGLGGGDIGAVTAASDGGVWIADRDALIHLGPAGMSSYATVQGLPGSSPTSLFEDSRGRLWAGVDSRLAWREHGRFFQLRMPDGSDVGLVRAMAEDRDGTLWAATIDPSRALVGVRDERVIEVISADQLGGRQASAMAADPQGGVWLGLVSSELKRYHNGRIEAHGSVGDPSRRRIHNLLPDIRGLWVGTNQGLAFLRHGKLSTLGTRNGLPCDAVEDAVWGGDGSLWLKTACGLVRIPAGELDAWIRQPERRVRVRVLDAFDGAQAGLSPFMPRSTRSLDGRLWFAIEAGGLQVLDPRRMRDNAVPPPVHILGVVADRKTYPLEPGLRLPPLTQDLEIGYTALSFVIPEKVRFRYRLEGAGGWHDAGTRREAYFNNLRPGSYRFHVVACNNDGVWNETGATLDFTLLPAFYQTRAFLLLCLAASVFLTWAIYRWHVREIAARLDLQFQERLAERTRVAQDLHDTLLQGFLSASMQLHVAVDELPPDAPEKPRLSRVLQLMRQVIEEGRNAVRGLRKPAQEIPGIDDLAQALARVPRELGLDEAAGLRVIVAGKPRPLRPLIRDEVYRISREALVNAFRHAEASAIEVEVEFAARALRICVRDDGRGIDPGVLLSGRDGHWGLSGMRERAEGMGARLKVWSRERAGTEIELSVPGAVAFRDQLSAGLMGWWRRPAPGSERDQ
ncbi:MAG TPA: two-component regulator propeller domain-containing protein [Thermoanaerobaculia bacterium]